MTCQEDLMELKEEVRKAERRLEERRLWPGQVKPDQGLRKAPAPLDGDGEGP